MPIEKKNKQTNFKNILQLKNYLIKQSVIIIIIYPHIFITFLLLLFLNPTSFLINFVILLLHYYTKLTNNLSFCDGPVPAPVTIPVPVRLERFEIMTDDNIRLNVQIIVIPNRPLIINVSPVDQNITLILEPM